MLWLDALAVCCRILNVMYLIIASWNITQTKLGIGDSALFAVVALGIAVPTVLVRSDGDFGKHIILFGDPV